MRWKRQDAPRYLTVLCFPALFILIITGCTKPDIDFGSNFTNNNATNVVAVDTFGVKMSTIFEDSFPTTGTGSMLIGRYQDPYFGLISSRSFFDIKPPSPLPTLTNYDSYDSISLILRLNKAFYGDTTQVQEINVNRLTELIQLPGNNVTFYNFNQFGYDPTPLGTTSFKENPTAGFTSLRLNDSVKVRLPDELGQQFFQLLYNQSDTVKNSSTFLNYFRGLVISPASTGAIFGFRDSAFVRLYYHEPGLIYTPKFTDFGLNLKTHQFNNITANRMGAPSYGIDSLNAEVSSAATSNLSFLQSATGLLVKLRFPTIGYLQQYQDYLSVLKAELTIKPLVGTYSPIYALPAQVNLYTTDAGNLPLSILSSGSGSLVTDYVYGENTGYTYDITGYIKQQIVLGTQANAVNGLILTIPSPATNTLFNRAVFGDQNNVSTTSRVSLKIYYASYY